MSLMQKLSRWNRQRLERRKFARQNKEVPDYAQWVAQHATLSTQALSQLAGDVGALGPRISVLMPTFNPDLAHLRAAVASVLSQTHQDLELCIADDASTCAEVRPCIQELAAQDPRIKFIFREANGHISAASNSALSLCTGEFVALLDQDDLLAPHALSVVAATLRRQPGLSLAYSDEDKIDENGTRFKPHFKPDWNVTLLRSQNYVCHLVVLRRSLIESIGGFRLGYEGAQDHDLLLRCAEHLRSDEVVHIPLILYHWRVHAGSTASTLGSKPYALVNGCKAVQDHLDRVGLKGTVSHEGLFYRVQHACPEVLPKVSIILLTRDRPELLASCVQSVLDKTSYPNLEILIVDNGTKDPQALEHLSRFAQDPRVQLIRDASPFNYSALNNRAARQATGTLLCLMNNDIEVLDPDWLQEMVGVASVDGVGVVGSRLYYPDGGIQHAGVILRLNGVAAHPFRRQARDDGHYMARPMLMQELSAVTAACLVTHRAVYDAVGGLDEEHLAVAFNDVDYCLKVREAGWKVIYDPHAEFIHHESVSRGRDNTPEKRERFQREVAYMKDRWHAALAADPAYNPNLTDRHENFSLSPQPRTDIRRWLQAGG